jgi:N6-adenosine-specific RNA methylase IME4
VVPFRTVVADPPWRFGDSLPGKTRGASKRYRTMTVTDIQAYLAEHLSGDERALRGGLNVPIADDALLFMWRVSAMVEEAYEVVRAWGFTPKAEIVWVKKTSGGLPHFGMGRYTRAAHETCIIARRGQATVRDKSIRSVFEAPVGVHSAKPDAFFSLVERLSEGPRLELFGRKARQGWTVIGDELPEATAAE